MKTSKALEVTRDHMIRYPQMTRFICCRLMDLNEDGRIPRPAMNRARAHIGELLGNENHLERWLWNNHGIKCTGKPQYLAKMRATRIAWLNDMIAHFKALGD